MSSPEDKATPTAGSTIVISDSVFKDMQLLPWGRLYSKMKSVESVDLVSSQFKFGRAENCDVIVTRSNFPSNSFINISQCHFVILKEYNGPVFITDMSKNGTFINGTLIGKGNSNILQNDDLIAVGKENLKIFIYKNLQSKEDTYLPEELKAKYETDRILGQGACGEVRLIFEKRTCRQYAIKRVKKGRASQIHLLNHPSKIQMEINILQSLSHPCIIGIKEIVETKEDFFIVLDYMKGGELTSRILSIDKMSEATVKLYFYQITLAIRYLHKQGIMHRDIKSENVLLDSQDNETLVKITDFGLSKIIDEETVLKTVCGTPSYVAPEVLDRHNYKAYGQQADVWSLGVLLYYMLSSELPFTGSDFVSMSKSILLGMYKMDDRLWSDVSQSAKDLIQKMLIKNPHERITVNEILDHPWFSGDPCIMDRVDAVLDPNGYQLTQSDHIISPLQTFEPPVKRRCTSFNYSYTKTRLCED